MTERAAAYRAFREGAALVQRATRGPIGVEGADRATYLQGLLTNDIVALTPGTGCYALYLTAQGRVIADMEVFHLDQRLLLDLHHSVSAAVVDRLRELVFTEEVVIQDWTSQWTSFGLHGPDTCAVVARALASGDGQADAAARIRELPDHRCEAVERDGTRVIIARTDELGPTGVAVFVETGAASSVHEALAAAGATVADADIAETVRIESARPAFPADVSDDTIPLEAGLEDRALSMTKGCYVGQEVIVRILHRGHGRVARRLAGLMLPDGDTAVPEPGAKVWHNSEAVGRVTSATHSPLLRRVVGLGYVPRALATREHVEVTVGTDRVTALVTDGPFVPLSARR